MGVGRALTNEGGGARPTCNGWIELRIQTSNARAISPGPLSSTHMDQTELNAMMDDDSLSLLSFDSDDVGSLAPEEAERLMEELDEYDAEAAATAAASQPTAPITPGAAPLTTDTRTERVEQLTDWISVSAPMEEDTDDTEPASCAQDFVTPTASLRTVRAFLGARRDDAHQMPGDPSATTGGCLALGVPYRQYHANMRLLCTFASSSLNWVRNDPDDVQTGSGTLTSHEPPLSPRFAPLCADVSHSGHAARRGGGGHQRGGADRHRRRGNDARREAKACILAMHEGSTQDRRPRRAE